MRKSIIFFFILIMCISRPGYSARLLIGLDVDQVYFEKHVYVEKGKPGKTYWDELDVCGPGYTEPQDSEIKNERDECGGDMDHSYRLESPSVWFETSPFYFGGSRWGTTLFINPGKFREIKIISFPNPGETAKIRFTARYLGLPFYYTFGSKELGKDGISFRIGFGPAKVYFDPFEIKSRGKKVVKNVYKDGFSQLLSLNWGYLSLNSQVIYPNRIKLDEFKNEYNTDSRLYIEFQILSISFVLPL